MNNQVIEQKSPVNSMSELLANTDQHVYNALKNSIYPGAKDESIAMVLAYCKSKRYDPLAKACHIVPMNVKDSKTGTYEWRDVILPGISGYRIDAARTGMYVGLSEPEYGPMITEKLGGVDVTYPEWCKITGKKRMQDGFIAEFVHVEQWIENYATKGKDSLAPNVMWMRRKKGQIYKCTEAQILRKMFPEAVGNLPTFEEMEGKELKTVSDEPKLIENITVIDNQQLSSLLDRIAEAEADSIKICVAYKIGTLEELNTQQFKLVINQLDKQIKRRKQKSEDSQISKMFGDDAKIEREEANPNGS